jgi:dienelactone hydrolase
MSTPAEQRRRELYGLLGDLPPRDRPISPMFHRVHETPAYVRDELMLDLNGEQPVPAYFIKPKDAIGPLPVILYNHAHGGEYAIGKEELFTQRKFMQAPYGPVLAAEGYAVLCIDHWAFGKRAKRTESDTFKHMLWRGQVMWGMMVYDSLRALDYVLTRPDVDPNRVATLGMSMGSTMAWWVAALDPRVKVCIDICCLTDFDALIEEDNLKGHGLYYYVPGLLKHFTAAEINALIAPRPHLSLAGNRDALTPAYGLQRIDEELKQVYETARAPQGAWKMVREDVGHQETPTMRKEVLAFLKQWL